MNSNIEQLQSIPYTVINDKALPHQDFLYKLIIIGDTGVGKSCLLARIMDNDFKLEHQVTIGVEFGSFACKLEEKIIKLQIWDTAGQESFRSITRIFYKGAHCVFLTYDITREDTFINARDWLKEVKQHANSDIVIYLIGNRCDLEEDREVTKEKAIEFCKQYNIDKFFETSAKTGQQVEEVFSLASKELYLQQQEQANEEQEEEEVPKHTEDAKNAKKNQAIKLTGKKQMKDEKKKGGSSEFCPSCAVFSSKSVKDILKKQSGLSPAELLRPFGQVGNLGNISLSTCEKNQPFRVKHFKINFVDSAKIDGATQSDQSMIIDYIIQNSAPQKFYDHQAQGQANQSDLELIKNQLLGLVNNQTGESPTPWFQKWKKQFLQTTKYTDHELIEQPIAFIYFICANEQDPLGTIDQLKRGENMPTLYRDGIYDDHHSNIQQYILILNPTNDSKVYQDAYDVVRQKFLPANINEIPMTKNNGDFAGMDDIWANFADTDDHMFQEDSHLDGNLRGRTFSVEDRTKIKTQIKRMIEKQILPFIEKKIRNLEVNLSETRKGIKNKFMNFWKKPERGENDGLKENFKMNKDELEMVSLVDLAFVAQDYETSMNNAKIPYGDFKKCKALRHAASCQEVQLYSQLGYDPNLLLPNNHKEVDQQAENAFAQYHKASKSQFLIRCALHLSEMYDCMERYQESANYLIKIANEIKEQSVIVPLFLEQAAYKYLHLRQYRKFALYMIQAGKSYEKLNLQNYSFNCFTIVHPFYQRHKGWNGIRFQLYSSLGRNSQNMGDINLAVQFFRNLLQLCCEFDHMQEQKNCLNEFLIAVQNWAQIKHSSSNLIGLGEEKSKGVTKKAHIGQLNLPIVMEDSIEVFISMEKLNSNRHDQMINNYYLSYPTISAGQADENAEYVIQQKAELNTTNCPWKYLAKHIFEHMNEEKRKHPEYQIQNESCQFNEEELNEFAIFDCGSKARKRDLTVTKIRKSFVNEPITFKLLMKNPLMTDLDLSHIRLICRYEDSQEQNNEEFDQLEKSLTLRNMETREIILEVIPKRAGKFIIERIEWALFDVVSCAYQLVKPSEQDSRILTQEELIVSKKLLDRENNFKYDILDRSGELQADMALSQDGGPENPLGSVELQSFIFTEHQKFKLLIKSQSKEFAFKNGYIVCSHPLIFGFTKMKLFDKVEPLSKFQVPLSMKSSLMHQNEIKFLIRYEIDNPEVTQKMARYRFTRLIFNMESVFAFQLKKHVHLSTKKANEHIINIQIVDNIASRALYQTPEITSIEIVNKKIQWTLKKKDEKGQFFIVMPHNQESGHEPLSILKYKDPTIKSIFEDESSKNFYDQELQFVMTKFKMSPTIEEEEVDIVVQWRIEALNKKGFYPLFKIGLMKMQKQLTEQQIKLQKARTPSHKKEEKSQSKVMVKEFAQMVNPLHVAYSYQREISHDFRQSQPLTITFTLSLSNMIQHSDFAFNCVVEAINEWCSLSNPTDVSEGNSFLWMGKTKHIIRNLKSNVSYFKRSHLFTFLFVECEENRFESFYFETRSLQLEQVQDITQLGK